ncbi:MAG: hypothetical protein AAF349_10260 [Cyanobacteria bacterium P01_A01_bin.68]
MSATDPSGEENITDRHLHCWRSELNHRCARLVYSRDKLAPRICINRSQL